MATFRETREAFLHVHDQQLINDEEFVFLYDIDRSKNFDFPYWNYTRFDLNEWTNDECLADFRFHKADLYRLFHALHIPAQIATYNRSLYDGFEAFCVFLNCYAYPCRYFDLVSRFGRPVKELCMMSNSMMNFIYENYNYLLNDFNRPWLSQNKLEEYSIAIHNKGAPLMNCFGFVDGTVRPHSRRGQNQRILFNGHKRIHVLKFQSVVIPNGLIYNLYGPVEGRRHDSDMLAEFRILDELQLHAYTLNEEPLCIYGDPVYPLRVHLQAPYQSNCLTDLQKQYNTAMSNVRVSVEWFFKEILTYFAFVDFKKNLKIGLSAIGKMYVVCALLTNTRTCLYKSQTSNFFGVVPPMLEEYFN